MKHSFRPKAKSLLIYLPSALILLGLQPAFSASISCEAAHTPANQRGERDFQRRLGQTGAKGLSAKRTAEAEVNAAAWIGQIQGESRQMNESKQTLRALQRELGLNKKLSELDMIQEKAKKTVEELKRNEVRPAIQKVPIFNMLCPHLFPKDFNPLSEADWQGLRSSDLVMSHITETWRFLSATEAGYRQLPQVTGAHLILRSQTQLEDIIQEKLRTASPEKVAEWEQATIDRLLETAYSEPVQKQVLEKIYMVGYSSENLLFELLELRMRHKLGSTARKPKEEGLTLLQLYNAAILKVAQNLRTASVGLQQYLLKDTIMLKSWYSLLLNTNERVIEPVQEVMKEVLAKNERVEDSMEVAEYFIRVQINIPEVQSFLVQALKDPNIDTRVRDKLLYLQKLAEGSR